jgi:hypothetical protein
MTKWRGLVWLGISTLFLLYCAFFPPSWLPQSGILSGLLASGGLLVIVFGVSRLGVLQLFLLGLGLDFLSELVGRYGLSAGNPLLLALSLLVGLAGVACLGTASIIGIRNKLRTL